MMHDARKDEDRQGAEVARGLLELRVALRRSAEIRRDPWRSAEIRRDPWRSAEICFDVCRRVLICAAAWGGGDAIS